MDYFMICQDKRLRNVAKVRPPASLPPRVLTQGQGKGTGQTTIMYVEESRRKEYPDYIEAPVRLVSEKIKRIISKYQKDILFQTVVLIEKESNHQEVYYRMTVPEIACAAEETVYDRGGHVEDFVLDEQKVGHARVFCAAGYGKKIIVRLDVAESMLRRDSFGIWFEKVKTAKEEE